MESDNLRELEKLNMVRPKSACCDPDKFRREDKKLLELLNQFKRPTD